MGASINKGYSETAFCMAKWLDERRSKANSIVLAQPQIMHLTIVRTVSNSFLRINFGLTEKVTFLPSAKTHSEADVVTAPVGRMEFPKAGHKRVFVS